MTCHPDVIGIDISKHHLDLHDTSDATTRRIAYDTALRTALANAGIAHARINPEQARRFARATGRRAKTDTIDARMLAALGQRLNPRPGTARVRLAALSRRRDQRVAMRKQERTCRSEQDDPDLVVDLDRAIQQAVRTSDALAHDAALLRSVPGIATATATVTVTVLLAQMPELGRISARGRRRARRSRSLQQRQRRLPRRALGPRRPDADPPGALHACPELRRRGCDDRCARRHRAHPLPPASARCRKTT